jgi:hypothetical protein
MQQHERLGTSAVFLGDGVEAGSVDDRESRLVLLEASGVRFLDEHVAREQTVPRQLRDHADGKLIALVRACLAVLDEQILALQVGGEPCAQRIVALNGKRLVDLAPPDLLIARGLLDQELVFG